MDKGKEMVCEQALNKVLKAEFPLVYYSVFELKNV